MRKLRLPLLRLSTLALAVVAAGCDIKGCREDNSSGLPAFTLTSLPQPHFGEAHITGQVRFNGTAPAPRQIGSSPTCGPVFDESIVVDAGDGLQNVLVYLDGVPASTGEGRDPVVLDQQQCRFIPHVVGIQVGQPFEVRNGDPMRHNVHYRPGRNPDENLYFSDDAADPVITAFTTPEERPFKVVCDVHPWMTAFVGVFAHPFFTVTGVGGAYEIEDVPAGEYELVAWHELFGERREPIIVADAGDLAVDFAFARP